MNAKRGRGKSTPLDELSKEIFSQNLQRLMKEYNAKQADIVLKTRIPKSTLNGYVKGTSLPNAGNSQKIADFFGVRKSELDPRFKSTNIIEIDSNKDFVKIPILGNIACGDPITAEENIEGYKQRSKDDLPGGNLFYLNARGSSMAPIIPDGSLVLCRSQADVESGEIAAVLVNGDEEATLKKVRKINGMIMLEPLNDTYEPFFITKDNPARIVGKALEVTAKL